MNVLICWTFRRIGIQSLKQYSYLSGGRCNVSPHQQFSEDKKTTPPSPFAPDGAFCFALELDERDGSDDADSLQCHLKGFHQAVGNTDQHAVDKQAINTLVDYGISEKASTENRYHSRQE